ncbi:MAG: hypothetical protein IT280_13515 [Ignavibacteria bacterium]|nr:hypothetical protein [Ignavibacteria bacterium]
MLKLISKIFSILYLVKLNLLFSSMKIFADAGESVTDDIVDDYSIEKGIEGTDDKKNDPPPPPDAGTNDDTRLKIGDNDYTPEEAAAYIKGLKDTDTVAYNGETLTKAQLAEKLNIKLDDTGAENKTEVNNVKDEIIIGGEKFSFTEIAKKAEEHFKEVDFSKLDDERKLEYYEAYTKLAHNNAWNKSFTRREQKLSDDKRDFKKEVIEFKTNAENVLKSNLALKAQLEKSANLTDDEINDIDDPIKQTEAINARANAKRDLQELAETMQENEKIANTQIYLIQKEELKQAASQLRTELEERYPEIKTSEDIDVINKKLKSTDPAVRDSVSKEDKLKLYMIKEIITTALRTGEDPEIIYEVNFKNRLNFQTSSNNTGGNNTSSQNEKLLPKDFHKLSLKEQMKLLQKLQKDNPSKPDGISSDKTNSTEKQTQNGQVMTEEQRSQELSKMGSGY